MVIAKQPITAAKVFLGGTLQSPPEKKAKSNSFEKTSTIIGGGTHTVVAAAAAATVISTSITLAGGVSQTNMAKEIQGTYAIL